MKFDAGARKNGDKKNESSRKSEGEPTIKFESFSILVIQLLCFFNHFQKSFV